MTPSLLSIAFAFASLVTFMSSVAAMQDTNVVSSVAAMQDTNVVSSVAADASALLATLVSALPLRLQPAAASAGAALLHARPPHVWAAHDAAATAPPSRDSALCASQGAFDLVPLTVANVSASAPVTTWGGDGCFTSVTATLSFSPSGEASVRIVGTGATSPLCGDVYVVGNSFSLSLPAEISALAPSTTLSFLSWDGADATDVTLRGVHVGLLPCGIAGTLVSALATVNIFSPLSGKIADLVTSNREFLNSRGVWSGPSGGTSPVVPFGEVQRIDASLVRSGDYFAILRYDGLDPMIAYGTGFGATGHSAVALWRGTGTARELFVIEDTDRDPFGPAVYFGSGAIKTPYTKWVELALNASYQVALLPLAPAFSSAFDEDAVWQWLEGSNGVLGSPYGYSNFLFSVLDRGEAWPLQSLPFPLDAGMLLPILNMADGLLGPAPGNETLTSLTIDTLLVRGLNKRLGTGCPTFACILAAVNSNLAAGLSPSSALGAAAIPERDEWRYDGSVSFVCSAFAAAAWKAGLNASRLLPAEFTATEQTPIDNVRMAIFDPAYWTLANCPVGLWTPTDGHGTVCQLMGSDRMPLNAYNTVPLYPRLNQHCGSAWPAYARCADGTSTCEC